MNKLFLRATGAALLAFTLAACDAPTSTPSSAPPTDEAKAAEPAAAPAPKAGTLGALPPVERNKARLALFRTNYFGLAVQPKVFVDGAEIGRCTPGNAYIVDLAPGEHQVSATTEAEKITTFSIAAGETAYINCSIGMGVLVGRAVFERVPQATAMQKAGKFEIK